MTARPVPDHDHGASGVAWVNLDHNDWPTVDELLDLIRRLDTAEATVQRVSDAAVAWEQLGTSYGLLFSQRLRALLDGPTP